MKDKDEMDWYVGVDKQRWEFQDYVDAKNKIRALLDCGFSFMTFSKVKREEKPKKELKIKLKKVKK